jgi:putative Ca2+/H+ antiporter (TMEM165/GDT1 family)
MTGLSVGIGYALPALLPKFYTHLASIVLFVYFGLKLLWDSRNMSTGTNAELEEAEEELAASFNNTNSTSKNEDKDIENTATPSHKRKSKRSVEEPKSSSDGGSDNSSAEETSTGGGKGSVNTPEEKSKEKITHDSLWDYLKYHWATLTSLFTMTFLAEWGDRSQIATIAMSSSKDPLGVALGGVIGHLACTVVAVVGGRILASKISERTLSICGGGLFLFFALLSVLQGPQEE